LFEKRETSRKQASSFIERGVSMSGLKPESWARRRFSACQNAHVKTARRTLLGVKFLDLVLTPMAETIQRHGI